MEIDLAFIGAAAAVLTLAYACVRNIKADFRDRITGVESKIQGVDHSLSTRIYGVESQLILLRSDIHDIDRRLCRLEGVFASKDCCVLRHDHSHKQNVE